MGSNVKEIYGLTPMQEGMLYHKLMNKESNSYHVQNAFWIEDKIDMECVTHALDLLTEKHEVLKSAFIVPKSTGTPWQTILNERKIELIKVDAQEDETSFIAKIKEADLKRGFDLQKDSLLRLTIITFHPERHLFMFSYHHIIMDGWCLSLVFGDFMRYYEALVNGQELAMLKQMVKTEKTMVASYGEYLKWLEKQDSKAGLAFWKEKLEHYESTSSIPAVYKPEHVEEQSATISKVFEASLTKELLDFAENNDITMNTITETAWGIVLQKYNNTDDVIFGKVVSGRNVPISGIDKTVGLFINTIPIRITAQENTTILELLKSVRDEDLQSSAYEYCSLAEIQNQLPQGSELIQSLCVFENYYIDQDNLDGDTKVKDESFREQTNYPLTVIFGLEDDKRLSATLLYDPAIYSEVQSELILERIQKVLEEMTSKPEQKITSVSMITEKEKEKILCEFNDTKTNYPSDKTVAMLFEEQVSLYPDEIALISAEEELTYQELNHRANAVALKLEGLGIQNEDFVGIIAERNLETVIGVLGIVKAGGVYVFIDPTYPQERIDYMLGDCKPKAILYSEHTISSDAPAISLKELKNENVEYISKAHSSSQLIYCIYTSGTTGNPKGTLVEEKSVIRLVKNTNYIELDKDTVIMQTGSLSFDASTFEIWGVLLNGGKMVLTTNDVIMDYRKMKACQRRYGVNTLWITSTLMNQFIATDTSVFDGIKCILTGGEKLSDEHMHIFKANQPDIRLLNCYGPTENTTFTTTYDIPDSFNSLPIGKPIANTTVYVMSHGNLCGIGVPGELCIAGDGVARGYLNREDLTRGKFLNNPYGEGNLYRSGDLACWLPDGNIEFLGRIDEQVKIRGFRIELGEIESVLRKIPEIIDATVIARTDESGDKAIYAYVVSDIKVNFDELQKKLHETLPNYMIPAYMMQIESIPITKNGKLDRRALPEIVYKCESEYIAPRTEMEKLVCQAFSEVVNEKQISVTDDFFLIGGHSLRATRLVNKIEGLTGVRITLAQVFERRTVELISELLEQEKENEYVPIPKADKKEYYAMSSSQKRTFLIWQIDKESISYNMPFSCKLHGIPDIQKIKSSVQEIINRHESLRTNFIMQNGEFVQQIKEDVPFELEYEEDTERSDEEIASAFVRPFDLGCAPLLRVKVVKREESEYLFLMDMHHIIGDGMSMGILTQEFSQLYNGETLSEEVHQYKDYSEWVQDKQLDKQKEYWIQQFEDEVPVLNLPLDYPRPQKQEYEGRTVRRTSGVKLKENISKLAEETKTTEYMIFLSALMVLMEKYSCQDDIVIGSPFSGRTHKDMEDMLGMFVNTLPMRGKPAKEKTFRKFLLEIKEICLKAYQNQEYPFEELVEAVGVSRDLSRNPLFDVMFAFQNNEEESLLLNGLTSEFVTMDSTVAKFDLTFNVYEDEGEYCISMDYCIALFNNKSAEIMVDHFMQLLQNITENVDKKIEILELTTKEEKEEILNHFSTKAVAYDRDKCVISLFEEQVAKYSEKTAVVCEERKLTFQELNEKASHIKNMLCKLGIGRNDFVVLLAKKSEIAVAGICGIIKAGAAYVPIDPDYPKERIQFILDDCQPKAILTCNTTIETDLPVMDLYDVSFWETKVEEQGQVQNSPDDLAYLIYTSGTTGKPKGVMIEQHSIVNLVKNGDYTELNNQTILLQTGQLAFDASTFELWGCLLNGGELHLVQESILLNPEALKNYIVTNKINTMFITTALFNYLIKYDNSFFDTLKHLMFGGEKTSEEHVNLLKEHNATLDFRNVYGPTETTTFATHYIIGENVLKTPIGKPIVNTQCCIMDGMNLCGYLVPGELCIGGEGVARGYLGRPELTAEKFIKNPYGQGKMYRSGDMVRWLPDGNIEFIGRIDQQVKIRGFRIEPEEIASQIRKLNDMMDAVVLVQEDRQGEKAVFAYYVAKKEIAPKELKLELSNVLPDYMVPDYMMQIDSIPVTKNGKIDKKALPDILVGNENEYVAPKTEYETCICQVFGEILGLEKVSVEDNFFAIGGHSLRATKVVNRVEELTGIPLPLRVIFTAKTAKNIASYMEDQKNEQFETIPKAEEAEFYPMSSVQKRVYIIQSLEKESVVYNMPGCYELTGTVKEEKIQQAVEKVVERHEILRTRFLVIGDDYVQKIEKNVKPEVKFIESDKPVNELMSEFIQPFDLQTGKLIRVWVVKGNTKQYLFMDIHHIACDGMSMGIVMKEFTAFYNEVELKPVSHQYKDYSAWMEKQDMEQQKAFWNGQFEKEIPLLELPYDYERPKEQSFVGDEYQVILPKKVVSMVKESCLKTGTTEYMFYLSALMIVLGKYGNQENVVIGSPVSGRIHRDTEDMLGMFVNTLALRGEPKQNMKFTEFLDTVKETCLKAFENQEYPFEQLVEELNVKRDLSRNPLFDVLFVLQNNEKAEFQLQDINMKPLEPEHTISKFDLTFSISDNSEDYFLGVEYCKALFKEETVKRMIDHYIDLLTKLCTSPEQMIGKFEMVTPMEREQILGEFNHTAAMVNTMVTVTQLFEEQVAKTPDETAVVFEETAITYAELNGKANKVADVLRGMGIKQNDFVTICAKRSLELIIAVYGVMKSGAAYVPLDPDYPEDRIDYIVSDCKPKAMLEYGVTIQSDIAEVMDIKEIIEREDLSDTNPEIICNPEDLIYCLYTSGTTGKPKGVMLKHSCLVNYCTDTEYGIMHDAFKKGYKKIACVTNLVFDICGTEILLSLLNGMCVYLANESQQLNVAAFEELVLKHNIEILQTTPSRMKMFLEDRSHVEYLKKIEFFMLGGEKVGRDLIQTMRLYTDSEIENVYGPTETTIWSSMDVIPAQVPANVSIGKPITNTQIYILNQSSLCGIGIPGELCIAGDGVAKGYLNRKELTEEKFIPNPYGDGKLYRTGDMAIWLPDGRINCLGRMDDQVKIRGHRIEPGEVESVMNQMDLIKSAAVVVREDKNKEKSLHAFFVSDQELSISDVRSYLFAKLPDYMVPDYMIQVDALPMNKNGKLDRKALPAIETKSEKEYIAPRNETEVVISSIFSEILSVEKVGVHDDFFELGGQSLRATRVINQLEMKTGIHLELKDLFNYHTVEELSNFVQTKEREEYEPIPTAKEKAYYAMSSTQKRTYLLWEMDKEGVSYNMPSCFRLTGQFEEEKAKEALQAITERHEILRTEFGIQDGELVQFVKNQAEIDFTVIEEYDKEESELLHEFTKPFNLEQAPLFRTQIVKRNDGWLLLFDIHHIIGDGASVSIIMKELMTLYNGGTPEKLQHQYKDYSEWMAGRDLEKQKEYWVDSFKESIPILCLPTDYKRPKAKYFHGSSVECKTGVEFSEKLESIARKTGTTEYMVFLSAAMVLLNKYSMQDDIVIGSPISGRTHVDTENMLGMFANTLAMRGKPERDKSYLDFLMEMKEVCLKAYQNQEYPFEELVENVNVQREPGRNPLFDVLLVLQNNEEEEFALHNVVMENVEMQVDVAKFGLLFGITKSEKEYVLKLEYCTDLFTEETAITMLDQYYFILSQIFENSEVKISQIQTSSKESQVEKSFIYDQESVVDWSEILVHPENIGLFRSQDLKQGVKVTVLADDLECDVKIPGRLCVSLPETEESEKTERYYVTDKIVRKTAEDTFEYFGNVNDRVLIHGGVVWLKQVEKVLMQLPYVEEAKVITRNDASKKTELYAYFTSVEVPDPLDVASAMGKELPGYMVPAYIMQVAEFEKEESGLIDIMSLPVIEIKTVRRYCAPRNEQEVDLCEAFEAVLNVQHVGIEDNFYELGGDSLQAMKIMVKLKGSGYICSINDILRSSKIKDIHLVKKQENDAQMVHSSETLKLTTESEAKKYLTEALKEFKESVIQSEVEERYPLSPIQQITITKNLEMGNIVANISGEFDSQALIDSIKELIASQGLLRSIIVSQDGQTEVNQFIVPEQLKVPLIDLRNLSDEEKQHMEEYLEEKAYAESEEDVYNRLLYYLIPVRYSDEECKIYMPFSHLIFDGMSMEILKGNLLRAYYGGSRLLEDEKAESYADYIRQIKKGPQDITEEDVIQKFQLNDFAEAVKACRSELCADYTNARIKLDLGQPVAGLDKDFIWNLSYQLFHSNISFQFDQEVIPFAIYVVGRQYQNKNFFNTIGEFLDILLLTDAKESRLDYENVKEKIKLVREKNINFMTLMYDQEVSEKYKQINALLQSAGIEASSLPVFNYLGFYEDSAKDLDVNQEVTVNETLTRVVNIFCRGNELYIETFCKEEQKEELQAFLQNKLNEYIKQQEK